MDALIGVDAGTTTIEAAAFSPTGEELAHHDAAAPVDRPSPGRVEVDMDLFWERSAAVIHSVVDRLDDDGTVIGVGVTGQGDGFWALDANGAPVGTAILWNDGRAAGTVRELNASGIADRVHEETGTRLFAGSSLSIVRFLAANEPDRWERTATILWCKDWLEYRLTGVLATDPSDASVFHDTDGDLADAALDALPGIADRLPRVVPGTEIIGEVVPDAAASTGLPSGTPVVSGTIDAVASMLGSGAETPGDRASVLGTTALHATLHDAPPADHTEAGSAVPTGIGGRWATLMGPMAGAPALDWARRTVAGDERMDAAEAAARSAPVACDGLLFLPFLSDAGERAPFHHDAARAAFLGLSPAHTSAHLLRAVYEGVALAARDCYERSPGAGRIHLSGGGAQSGLWPGLFADCLDAEVTVAAGPAGARGAALLAGVGTGRYAGVDEAVSRAVAVDRVASPDPRRVRAYDAWYDHYVRTYEALFDVWERRSSTVERIQQLSVQDQEE